MVDIELEARRHAVLTEIWSAGVALGLPTGMDSEKCIPLVCAAAKSQAARMEVLEREYATLSRMISNLEKLHAQQEMQGVQDSVCSNEANAGRVLDGMCCGVGKAET